MPENKYNWVLLILISMHALTLCVQAFAQLGLCLSVGSESSLGVELVGHGGGSNHRLQAACALRHILLGVEENHVDLGHVEEPERHGGAQTHGDGQRGGLDVHLQNNTNSLALLFDCSDVSICVE